MTVPALNIGMMMVCGLLCIAIPVGAIIVFKLKNKEVPLICALWGALGFVLFAMTLEQLLHALMLTVLGSGVLSYAIYGAFAAGIFEETARFLVFKSVMRKSVSPKDSIMYGLGHGGVEAALIAGVSLLNSALLAIVQTREGWTRFWRYWAARTPLLP